MPLKSGPKLQYHAFSNSTAPLITHISDNLKAEAKTNSKKYTCYRLIAWDLNVVFLLGPQSRFFLGPQSRTPQCRGPQSRSTVVSTIVSTSGKRIT